MIKGYRVLVFGLIFIVCFAFGNMQPTLSLIFLLILITIILLVFDAAELANRK